MLYNNKNLETAEDLLGLVDVASLNATLHRDMKSSVKRVCDVAGCTPRSLRLEVHSLRETLSRTFFQSEAARLSSIA